MEGTLDAPKGDSEKLTEFVKQKGYRQVKVIDVNRDTKFAQWFNLQSKTTPLLFLKGQEFTFEQFQTYESLLPEENKPQIAKQVIDDVFAKFDVVLLKKDANTS
jgi:hypothetical protein